MSTNSGYDVIVVGARAAGAATAMLLAKQGLRVLAIDRARYATDTLSTHALMRGAVLQLSRWGILPAIEAAPTPAVRFATFHYGGDAVRVPVKPRDGVRALFAPRRYLLDRLLIDAAMTSGADVRHGLTLTDLIRGANGRVMGIVAHDTDGRTLQTDADMVIGADGLWSSVARLTAAPFTRRGRHAAAIVYGYWSNLGVDGYEWHWGDALAIGAIPTNGGETCVFVAVPAPRFADTFHGDLRGAYIRLLSRGAPALAARIVQSGATAKLRGFAGHHGFLRQCVGPGWALVGDAGYFKDPLTAHGLTDALRDAEILANAIAAATPTALAQYQQKRDDLSIDLFDTSDSIASFEWDLTSIRNLHERLSDAMSREVAVLRSQTWFAGDDHERTSWTASRPQFDVIA